MADPATETPTRGPLGPDPGRSIRVWVTMLLRLGIGLSLLSTGLTGYYGLRATTAGMGRFGMGSALAILDPFLSGLPYLAIALGLALILGFLTTAAAIGAGFLSLLPPVFAIVSTALNGANGGPALGGNSIMDQFLWMMTSMSVPGLLTNAALIWLSPLENNPFSVDALIFGRDDIAPIVPGAGPISPSRPEPDPEFVPETVDEVPVRIGD